MGSRAGSKRSKLSDANSDGRDSDSPGTTGDEAAEKTPENDNAPRDGEPDAGDEEAAADAEMPRVGPVTVLKLEAESFRLRTKMSITMKTPMLWLSC